MTFPWLVQLECVVGDCTCVCAIVGVRVFVCLHVAERVHIHVRMHIARMYEYTPLHTFERAGVYTGEWNHMQACVPCQPLIPSRRPTELAKRVSNFKDNSRGQRELTHSHCVGYPGGNRFFLNLSWPETEGKGREEGEKREGRREKGGEGDEKGIGEREEKWRKRVKGEGKEGRKVEGSGGGG